MNSPREEFGREEMSGDSDGREKIDRNPDARNGTGD